MFFMRGYTLLDMMVAMIMISVMVVLLGVFVQQATEFAIFRERSEQLRRESFAVMQQILPSFIREAVAIDYERSTGQEMVLWMDKWTRDDAVSVKVEEGQLILERNGEGMGLLSENVQVSDLRFEYSENPKVAEDVSLSRTYQPMVSVSLQIEWAETQQPRLWYESAFTLRNASLSTLP